MSDTQLLALAEQEIKRQHDMIGELLEDRKVMIRALKKIICEDYRGNRDNSFFIAQRALKELKHEPNT